MNHLAACALIGCIAFCPRVYGQNKLITTYAGHGNGYSGDGGSATSATLDGPSGLAMDSSGNLYIADTGNNVVRKVSHSGIITTYAGNGNTGSSGDGGPATAASLNINIDPVGLAVDTSGNLYIADTLNNRVRMVLAGTGIITTVAGNGFGAGDGVGGFSGDGGPATAAELFAPTGLAIDSSGNLYIADLGNMRVRKVSSAGIITTIAGSGCTLTQSTPNCGGFSGDGGPANSATLNRPAALALDVSGNLYIADNENNRVRKVSPSGIITTFAGIGPACEFSNLSCTGSYTGDGGSATSAALNAPEGLAVDRAGNVYISDTNNSRVRVVSPSGVITTYAGDGQFDYNIFDSAGDGGPATSALINLPDGLATDAAGDLFIADNLRGRVREVIAAGSTPPAPVSISGLSPSSVASGGRAFTLTVNGSGFVTASTVGWNGAVVPTTYIDASRLNTSISAGLIASAGAASITVVTTGSATSNAVILTISPGVPVISSLSPNAVTAGGAAFTLTLNGSAFASGSIVEWNGSPVSTTYLNAGQLTAAIPGTLIASAASVSITVNSTGAGTSNAVIFTINPSSPPISGLAIITTLAGNGTDAESGDCGPASAAALDGVQDVAVDRSGNVFIVEEYSGRLRKISPGGIITTLVGGNVAPCSGEPAPVGYLSLPSGLAVDAEGNVFIADRGDNRVVRLGTDGVFSVVAGDGRSAFSGDGGPAISASLNAPIAVAVDASGNVFISDSDNSRVRKVSPNGTITTYAGNGNAGFSGDGGPATSASLNSPSGLAIDATGNLYIADLSNRRIRKVATDGTIGTIAGNGSFELGANGDGGPASAAELSLPAGIRTDASGNLFIADFGEAEIRKISPSGIITTVAGNGNTGFSGDGGPAILASLNNPHGVAIDMAGNIYIGDYSPDERVRKVSTPGTDYIENLTLSGTATCTDSFCSKLGTGPLRGTFSLDITAQAIVGPWSFTGPFGTISSADTGASAYVAQGAKILEPVFQVQSPSYLEFIKFDFSNTDLSQTGAIIPGPGSDACINIPGGEGGNAACDPDYLITGSDTAAAAPVQLTSIISGLSPSSVTAGGPAFTLTVNGFGFASGSTVEWSGSPVTTSYVSANQLTASIPASLIVSAVTAPISVVTTGAGMSNAVAFAINPPAPAPPVISGLSPNSATAGGPAFTLTVNGSGFVSGSNVEWNGSPVATNYISASQVSATIPANLIKAAGSATVTVVSTGAGSSNGVMFPVFSPGPNAQTISHIADGGGWRSSIILVNTDTVPALYAVNFWNDSGASYSPTLVSGTATGSIPVGGSTIIQTADTGSTLTTGWAEVTSNQSLGGTAIFRYDPWSQEAAVPLLTSGGVKLEIPYQVGSGLSLGIALANPNATQSASLTEVIRGQSGNQLASRTLTLPALNHTSFNPSFPATISGGGVVEYDSSVNVFGLGIRSAPEGSALAFTSLDAVLPVAASTKTISHIADGGGWRSSIVLVNTDTVPASYAVSFRNDAGGPYTPALALGTATGSIPVGGSTVIETADPASSLTTGWAQVTSSQSLGGTAIFRYDPWSQEAAVPLLTSGGATLEIPYQVGNGLSLGVALANPSATQTASITEVIRDQNGNQVASRPLTLAPLNHTSFNPAFPSGINGGGVVEYDSNVSIFGLGIRSAPEASALAFTSVRAAYK